jgi:hypothetical protein
MQNMSIAIDSFLASPWLILLGLAVVIGLWRGRRRGARHGLKAGAIVAAIGVAGFAAFSALVAVYYATGGH